MRPTTDQLLVSLGHLGHNQFDVSCGKSKPVFDAAWLYDLVWYLNDESGDLVSIPLVLESELQLSEIQHRVDFQKLLNSNAKNKVMICQCYTDQVESRLEKFQSWTDKYEEVDDNRILVGIFDVYTHQITSRLICTRNRVL